MSKKITVTGATGNIASLVIPTLLEKGAQVKALVRNPSKAEELKKSGVEIVEGEFTDADAAQKVMEGADSVLLIAPPNPDAVKQNSVLITAAKNSGNPHVVRISAIGAAADAPTENGKLHHQSDNELAESGLPHTILRPHFFMQNLFMSVPTITEQGQMYWGMGDARLGLVDVRDIADCAAVILLEGGHEGKIYTPTGSASISFKDIAGIISKAIGKEVTYTPVSYDAVKQSIIEMGWGEWGGQIMYDYSKAYSEGWGDFVNDDVETITGNKARSFEQFVNEVLSHAFQNKTRA
ncbi:MAG: SDR family oxidoreductase [Gemmatimonadetes bacterium]|nr:SDR family oxidoreductase [Gemmatimonadota bacterium]